jgi:hypothetical protein
MDTEPVLPVPVATNVEEFRLQLVELGGYAAHVEPQLSLAQRALHMARRVLVWKGSVDYGGARVELREPRQPFWGQKNITRPHIKVGETRPTQHNNYKPAGRLR